MYRPVWLGGLGLRGCIWSIGLDHGIGELGPDRGTALLEITQHAIQGQGKTGTEYFLDSCEWGSSQTEIQVTAGADTVAPLQAPPAVPVQIHLDDPNALLSLEASPAKASAAKLDLRLSLLLLAADRIPHYMPIVSSTPQSREHVVLVPPGTAFTLLVKSPAYALLDAKGKPVTGEVSIGTSASSSAPIRFTVAKAGN